VFQDFTTNKDKIHKALNSFAAADGTAPIDVDMSTSATDEAQATATDDTTTVDESAQALDTFNNDVRLIGLKTICDALKGIQQKKAMLYFSSGMTRTGSDNQVQYRAATNACAKSNVMIDTIDARGLQAVVAGGNARSGGRGGNAAFTGAAVRSQFTALASSQETLQGLSSDTGGTSFTDSNDFGEAFTKVEKDLSSYYIIGYSSPNQLQDGRFIRIDVKILSKIPGLKIDKFRQGYYADRDFSHLGGTDRAAAMQDQLYAALPATDVPMFVSADYFRLPASACANMPGGGRGRGGPGGGRGGGQGAQAGGRGGQAAQGGRGGTATTPGESACYYVPVSLEVPGSAVPVSSNKVTLDILGYVQDERRQPLGNIKTTYTVPPAAVGELAASPVMYQTGVKLPPGNYAAKMVVRENTSGQMGTFELKIPVPDLSRRPVKMSSVVLSTQLTAWDPKVKTDSPLVHDGVQIVPNLTHIVGREDELYFYYEVYDPQLGDDGAPQIRTYMTFFKNKTKVFETPVIERTTIDAADRKASVFQFDLPGSALKAGLYTCQVNVIDEVSGKFAFSRFDMFVREKTDKK
jgi:VWFA-related protein